MTPGFSAISCLSRGLDRWVSRLTLAFAWLGDVGSGTLYELGSELFFALVKLSFVIQLLDLSAPRKIKGHE